MPDEVMNATGVSVEAFIDGFYGYGNLAGKYWLIGPEEAGGVSQVEVEHRLQVWQALGAPATADLAEFHLHLGMPQFFQEPVVLQPTWAHLIRIVLSLKGVTRDEDTLRAYQKDCLGRLDGETCLLELLPLPSPNTRDWRYADWYPVPYLESRETYRQACLPWRVAHLRELVQQYMPEVVICYGVSYRTWFEALAGNQFLGQGSGAVESVVRFGTLFVLLKHPAAPGVGKTYFKKAGNEIHKMLEVAHGSL